ncbi:EAL domain-containing protein [Gammaproteobacteria bacterium]|nr:EAL domain-containing protein [Gammaproteobacteria bacterium]
MRPWHLWGLKYPYQILAAHPTRCAISLVPASFVKLDSTILSKIDINQESLGNLHAMISALHELQIKIIAPLLERPPILPLLWQAGVDFLQGNCLDRPSPSMDFEFIESITVSFR